MLLNQDKKYTYEEYLQISKNERCEFIDGYIYMMSSPSVQHQNVIGNIFFVFKNYFNSNHKDCIPFIAPLDVEYTDQKNNKKIVQPDVFVVCDNGNIQDNKYKGIPALIVEVVSPANSSHDYVTKLDLYLQMGVKEYWIINPMDKNMILYCFENNKIASFKTYQLDEMVQSYIFENLTVKLSEIM